MAAASLFTLNSSTKASSGVAIMQLFKAREHWPAPAAE